MTNTETLEARILELEDELEQQTRKVREQATRIDEQQDLIKNIVDTLDRQVETIDGWIEVFGLKQNEDGVWLFNARKGYENAAKAYDQYNSLVKEWNKFVPQYNTLVGNRDIGRPLAASEAQQADVKKRRKAGESLRMIADRTGLSLRTVRTILDKAAGKARGSEKAGKLRKAEYDRQRAAAYRRRLNAAKAVGPQVQSLRDEEAEIRKAVAGLRSR